MNLDLNLSAAEGYKSKSQIARVLTEDWVLNNAFCPQCGTAELQEFSNNQPVADFFCEGCKEEYELKSKKGAMGSKIVDGAYSTMIQRVKSPTSPNLFFLNYSFQNRRVNDFLIIPKYFFSERIIEKRKPLASTAKRSGWVGCNILVKNIPNSGKVYFVKDGCINEKELVCEEWHKTSFVGTEPVDKRGWLLDVLNCVDRIPNKSFELADVYFFEDELARAYPENKFIKPKIRQQLQVLRDKGYIEFEGGGRYRKL